MAGNCLIAGNTYPQACSNKVWFCLFVFSPKLERNLPESKSWASQEPELCPAGWRSLSLPQGLWDVTPFFLPAHDVRFSLCALAAFVESLSPAALLLAVCMGLWVTVEVTWSAFSICYSLSVSSLRERYQLAQFWAGVHPWSNQLCQGIQTHKTDIPDAPTTQAEL